MLSSRFIAGSREYNTIGRPVSAPFLRRSFVLPRRVKRAEITVCGLGFYRLFVNGQEITKGHMAPYISNPDQIAYYDRYQVAPYLVRGENVIGVILGNGFQNALDNNVWSFESAVWRSAPKLALALEAGGELLFEADETFRAHASPITFDDERCGERYDARLELPGWNLPGYDDSAWSPALLADPPKGERRICGAQPLTVEKELRPKAILPANGGYLFDFGENNAGVCRLKIKGEAGQRISFTHGEIVEDGRLDLANITFGERSPEGNVQRDEYILKGGEEETYAPSFTYHGFRYVFAEGLLPGQVKEDTLTFLVIHSALKSVGEFRCDCEMVNRIQDCTRRSDLANFVYFPTDCPQREKNGWTGDAALSAEQLLYNFDVSKCLGEWLNCIRKTQTAEGAIPGIIPTAGWGYEWGNGPAWDDVLVELPYRIHLMTGDMRILRENADAIFAYVNYMAGKRNGDGLLAYGLGDWCETGTVSEGGYATPLEVTDSAIGVNIADKAGKIFRALKHTQRAETCETLEKELKASFLAKYVRNGRVSCRTQTGQAMALAYGILPEEQREAGFSALLELIAEKGGHFSVGVLGGRVLFDVLAEFGRGDLALDMMIRPDFPSYAYPILRGATTLWEGFHELTDEPGVLHRKDGVPRMLSLNHHFWGFVSGWFYKTLAGIRVLSCGEVEVAPQFVEKINWAQAFHAFPDGEIAVEWRREGDVVRLSVFARNVRGVLKLPAGLVFGEGGNSLPLTERMELVAIKQK